MIRSGLILLFLLLSGTIIAQPTHSERIEIDVDHFNDDFDLIPAGNEGLLVFSELNDENEANETLWLFEKYDRNFKKVWQQKAAISKKYSYRNKFFDEAGHTLYLLFSKNRSEEYELVSIDMKNNEINRMDGFFPKRFEVDRFVINNNAMLLVGSVKNVPMSGFVPLNQKGFKALPIRYDGETTVEDIEFQNETTDRSTIIYSNYVKKTGTILVGEYEGATLMDQFTLRSGNDNNLLSAKILPLDDKERLMLGTYSLKKEQSTGMYFARLNRDSPEFIKFHHFGDFDNFFSYLPERKQEKLEKKQLRKKENGKELNLNYRLLVHDLIQRDQEYIIVAEAYYPTYTSVPYTTTVMVNRMSQMRTAYRMVFDGYLYTHGVVASFNHNGEKLWDHTFVMTDIKSFALKKHIRVGHEGEQIELVYGSGESVKSMIINGSSVVQDKIVSEVETDSSTDKVKKTDVTNMAYWHDNYFLAWGYQKIRNKEEDKRKVVFLTKLGY